MAQSFSHTLDVLGAKRVSCSNRHLGNMNLLVSTQVSMLCIAIQVQG